MEAGTRMPKVAGACLVAGPVGLAASIAIAPPLSGTTKELLTRLAAHRSALLAADLIVIVAVLLLVPASLGLAQVLRARGSRLAPIGAAVFAVGWLFVLGQVALDRFEVQLATSGIPLEDAVRLADKLDNGDVGMGVVSALFILGHTVGAILVGVALARSRFVPLWASAAIVAGAILHPIARVGVESKPLDVAAFALVAAGLATAGVRLLRTAEQGSVVVPA